MTDSIIPARQLRGQVAVATLARLVINIGQRMLYPFLPAISRGLGISIQSAGLLLTFRSMVGLIGPVLGPISDRFGRRRMLTSSMLIFVAATLFIILVPHYPVVALGFIGLGLSKVIFDPNLQAYLGDQVAYARRGKAIAFTELSWGGAILLGAPLMGWIIARWGWSSTFVVIAAAGLLGWFALQRALPPDENPARRAAAISYKANLGQVVRNPAALAMMGISFLVMAANELVFLVYGSWMETSFGLSVGRLGMATVIIGLAEISAELGVGELVDRLGKRRVVAAGLILTAATYLLLPLAAGELASALACLFVLFVCFEVTVVACLPLATELVPQARATMMALDTSAFSLGRTAGTLIGPLLWLRGGLATNSLVAAMITLCALGLLLAFIHQE